MDRAFLSGNATAGGAFVFFLSLLPGDSNQDGMVTDGTNGSYDDRSGTLPMSTAMAP